MPLPESPISIYNLMPEKNAIQEQGKVNNIPTTNDNISSNMTSQNNDNISNSSNYNNSSTEIEKFNIVDIFLGVYKSMIIFFLLVSIMSYTVFLYKSSRTSKEVKSEHLQRLRVIKRKLKIRRRITLIYGDTAFIYSFFNVKLVIPEGIPLDELDAVLIHELIHYKYGDLLINWILVVLKAIY